MHVTKAPGDAKTAVVFWACEHTQVDMLQVTIISIATMNIGKYYKAPYNIGVVGKVCCSFRSLLTCLGCTCLVLPS